MKGKVYLVGAGPGDPELLTLKALRILRQADVVLHDELVARDILELVSPAARIFNVGKRCGRRSMTQVEINSLMIGYARAGLTVVRLKGGDPSIFGRAGEEIEALHQAGADFEVVPGITAALAVAAAAGISLTDRRRASSVVFLTGHRSAGKHQSSWPASVPPDTTVVVYMPGVDYARITSQLSAAGLDGRTPCLIVSQASTAEQELHRTTLCELPEAAPLASPKLLIVGEVAASHLAQDQRAAPASAFVGV